MYRAAKRALTTVFKGEATPLLERTGVMNRVSLLATAKCMTWIQQNEDLTKFTWETITTSILTKKELPKKYQDLPEEVKQYVIGNAQLPTTIGQGKSIAQNNVLAVVDAIKNLEAFHKANGQYTSETLDVTT